jgi:hypothetical protein
METLETQLSGQLQSSYCLICEYNHHVAIKHLLTRSGLTHPEVSSKVFLGSFCLLGCSFLSVWVICTWHSIYMLYPVSLVALYFV